MSKNNKRLAARNPSVRHPIATKRSPGSETVIGKRQDRRISWSSLIIGASFLVSLASAAFTYWQAQSSAAANKIAQMALDRVAGKVQAQFEFVDDQKGAPDRFKEFMRKKEESDQLVFRVDSVDELMRWSPYVKIKNAGEPIDAIKTDVHYDIGAAYGIAVQQIEPGPIVINETSTYEATTFGKLEPGGTARIYVAPLLLDQITRLKLKDYADKDQIGMFTVTVYCRLVGSSSYDRVGDHQPVVFTFHWRPAGFKPEAKNIKELLEKKPWVVID
jgi:hypothetical protein